jgi:hypothetical protein
MNPGWGWSKKSEPRSPKKNELGPSKNSFKKIFSWPISSVKTPAPIRKFPQPQPGSPSLILEGIPDFELQVFGLRGWRFCEGQEHEKIDFGVLKKWWGWDWKVALVMVNRRFRWML